MRKGFFLGFFMTALLAFAPVHAEEVNSLAWLRGDYIGVGSIDVHKFVQRRIYTYLMDFFMTDARARTAIQEIRDAGIRVEELVVRITAGVPNDVDRSEHIVFWETSEDLSKYEDIISRHSKLFDVKSHMDFEYYSTKRGNECLAIHGNVLILGSELKVREVITSIKEDYKSGPQNAALASEIRSVDKTLDAWFVFTVTPKLKKQFDGLDPVIDRSQAGQGQIKLGEIRSGRMTFDFSNGLNVRGVLAMQSEASAKQSAALMNADISNAASDKDVKELGFDTLVEGISFKSENSNASFSVVYDQDQFDRLIALVTQAVKSIPRLQTSKPQPKPKPKARPVK